MNIILSSPKDFASPLTYQNSNYTFPHADVLYVNLDELKKTLFNNTYILPDYIRYNGGNVALTLQLLKNDQSFTIIGISFLKLKGLEEQFNQLYESAERYKLLYKHGKFDNLIQHYINDDYKIELDLMISKITTFIQIIMINIISDVINDKSLEWVNQNNLIELLDKFNRLYVKFTPTGVSEAIYFSHVTPLLIKIYNILEYYYIIL